MEYNMNLSIAILKMETLFMILLSAKLKK